MDDSTRERLVDGNIWLRGLHMVIFLIAYNIAEIIVVLLAVFQFLSVLITGRANEPLLRLGKNLSIYIEEVWEFLTFNSEIRPFPWEPWPNEEAGGENWRGEDTPVAAEAPVADEAVDDDKTEVPDDKDKPA